MSRKLERIFPKPDRIKEEVVSIQEEYELGANRKVPRTKLVKVVRVTACYKNKEKAREFWLTPDGRSKFFDAFPDEEGYYCVYWYERRLVKRR